MSIKTLIEAAEYVDNVETTTADERSNCQTTMTSSQTNVKTSKDVTIQHWRKRAVAQSVKELSKTSDVSKDKHLSNETPQPSTQEASLPIQSDLVFKETTSSLPGTASECAVKTTTEAKSASSERLSNGTHGIGSVNASHTSFPMALGQTTAPLLFAPVPLATFAVHNPNSLRPQPSSMPSTSGEVSGTPSQSLPGHRSGTDVPVDALRKKTQLGAITREAHNKLEKSRRAHLKGCYHRLRSVVPNLRSKVSNLVILRESLKYVQELQQKGALLEEERSALIKQKEMKELKVLTLKGELLRYIKPAELDELLRRVGLNGIFKPRDSGTGFTRTANLSTTNCKEQTSSTNTSLSVSSNVSPNQPSTSTKTSVQPLTSAILTPASKAPLLISSDSALSSVNLVWENKNDSRRVCTMLPAPQMLSSAQIRQNTDEQAVVKSSVPLRHSPVSSLTHFKPISVNSASLSNVKSYTGWNIASAEMPGFMEGRHSPLKIVVKPVDSAKQQARVAKSTSTHQKLFKAVSCDETNSPQKSSGLKAKPSELVFRPRSSVTPPPPSNITPYFPRFSVGSGGSPPLTTIFPNMSDGSNQSIGEETEQAGINAWPSDVNSDTELSKAGKNGKEKETVKRKMEGSSSGSVDTKISKIQKPDSEIISSGLPSSSNIPEVSKPSSRVLINLSGLAAGIKASSSTVLIPMTTPSFSSPLSSQSRSVTQVCFSTITSSKPSVPASSHEIIKSDGASTGSFAMPAMPAFTLRSPNHSSQSSRYQLPLTMMTPIMSASSGRLPAMKSNPDLPGGSRPSSASSTDSQPGPSVRMAAPQVQYLIPMGYPGMIAMPNGAAMAFPQPVGGFVPMMPSQGQGCGYVMPHGMVMMKSPEPPSEPVSSVPNSAAPPADTPGVNSQETNPPVQNGNVFSPSHAMQPVMMAVQPGFVESNAKQSQKPAPQQVQVMSPSFQPANPIMVPVAADQSGAFMFGGTPTMMPTNQGTAVGYQMPMNIIGYPMQIGGASMQFAMPQGSVSMPRGFSFGFAGGVQPGMMAVGSTMRSRQGSMSGSDAENARPT